MEQNDSTPVVDVTRAISERTASFAGREWIFKAINGWLADPQGGSCFLLTGEPGSGKTAIASRLVQFSQGVVAPPDGMEYLVHDFLSASYFCSARENLKLSPYAFVETLALQLAARYPVYAKALVEKNSDGKIVIEANQYITHMDGGQATGIHINTLNLGGVAAEDAFNRAVLVPLQTLFAESDNIRVVILVDALDEALSYSGKVNIVSLLSRINGLLAGVRFMLTSRPDARVESVFQDADGLFLSDPKFDQYNQADVERYVAERLCTDKALAERAARLAPAQVTERVNAIISNAAGNFQYVRFLLDAMAKGQRQLTELAGLPEGLDGLYFDSLERVVQLGQLDWLRDYAPLMSILTVAQENLTLAQLEDFTGQRESTIWAILDDLQQFIKEVELGEKQNETEMTFRIYHQSVIDFLQHRTISTKRKPFRNRFYLPAEEGHTQIVGHYRTQAASWEQMDWVKVDDYGLHYLPAHLNALSDREDSHKDLYALICAPFMRASRMRFGSFQPFAVGVSLAIEMAGNEQPLNLTQVLRGSLIYATLGVLATNVPPETLNALARLDMVDKAIGFAALMQNAEKQSQAYILIGETLLAQQKPKQASEVFELALKSAKVLGGNESIVPILGMLALSLVHAGEKERASEVVTGILTGAETIWPESRRAILLNDAAWNLVQGGEQALAFGIANQALSTAEVITDKRERAFILSKIAILMSQLEDSKRTTDTANQVVALLEHEWEPATSDAPPDSGNLQLDDALPDSENLRRGDDTFPPDFFTSFAGGLFTNVAARQKRIQDDLWDREFTLHDIVRFLTLAKSYDQTFAVMKLVMDETGTGVALSTMGSALYAGREEVGAALVAEQALKVAEGLEKASDRVSGLVSATQLLLLAKQEPRAAEVVREALDIAETIEQEGDKVLALSSILMVQNRPGEDERLATLAKRVVEMAGMVEDGWKRSSLAQSLAIVNQFDQARDVIELIGEQGEKALALSALSLSLARAAEQARAAIAADQAAAAIEAFKAGEMIDQKRATTILHSVIQNLVLASQFDAALRLAATIGDEYTQAIVKSNIALSMIEAGQSTKALPVVNSVVEAQGGWGPWDNAMAFAKIALLLAQQGEQDHAQVAANRALERARVERDAWFKIQALLQITHVFTLIEQFEQALMAAETIEDVYWKAAALSYVVHGSERVQTTNVVAMFDQTLQAYMQQKRCDKWDKTAALCDIAYNLTQTGAQASAVQVAGLADTIEESRDIHAVLLDVSSNPPPFRKENQAWSQAEVMGDVYWTALVFLVDVPQFSHYGWFDKMLRQAVKIGYQRKKAFALSKVGYILSLSGDKARAQEKFSQAIAEAGSIPEPKTRVPALSEVAQILAQAGEQALAKEAVHQALTVMDTLGETGNRLHVLTPLARALIQVSEQAQAVLMATRAVEAAHKIDDMNLKATALKEAVVVLAQAGDVDQAINAAMTIGVEGYKTNALADIVEVLAQASNFQRALSEVEAIAYEWPRARALSNVAHYQGAAGQAESALQTLQCALTTARGVGRSCIWEVLYRGVDALAPAAFWQLYETVQGVENWW